jgi:hypothetical protein
VVGTPDQVLLAFERLQAKLPTLSLTINTSKSLLLYFHEETHPLPSHVRDSFQAHHIRVETRHAVVLGAVIGATDQDIVEGLRQYWKSVLSMTAFFRRLNGGLLRVQNGMLLLRMCGVPKLSYILRCTPPRLMEEVTELFDDLVMDSALHLLDIQPGEDDYHIRFWLRAPLTDGGFGLMSTRELSPRAYVSSLASIAASEWTSLFTQYGNGDMDLDHSSNLNRWIKNALEDLRTPPPPFISQASPSPPPFRPTPLKNLPPLDAPFFPYYRQNPAHATSLQHKLTQQATKHQLNYATSELVHRWGDVKAKAHLHSISAPHAHTWKMVHPISTLHTLTDAHYRIAARLNLGLPPHHNQLPRKCTSCGKDDALDIDPWHHLSCISHKSREITGRHNAVLYALYAHVRSAGGVASMEPKGLSADRLIRPDLQISFPGQHILTDVVVSHPLCPSHVHDAARKPLAVAEQAARGKHRSYDETARLHHMRLLPFSVESMGGLSSEAEQLVEQIGLACRDHLTLETHESIARGVRAAVAVAVQKGNAMAVLAGYSRAVMRGGHPSVPIGA